MKPEITKIITTMMESYDEYHYLAIAKGIRSLAKNWPSLTEDEKKEIEAAATAFSVMAIEHIEDEENLPQENLSQENFYEPTASTYSNNSNVKKIGLFRRK